jgi:2-polyprenyl-3-methyl-5-hydroxy-6-metoxy-1,4-benzoquinol methylase
MSTDVGGGAIGRGIPGYYSNDRAETLAELEPPLGRVLDVGCGTGAAAAPLRAAGATRITGIEIEADVAAVAKDVYDEVAHGSVEEVLASGAVTGQFDTILCYDVLEHVVEPGQVVAALREVAAPGGRLHISIPNARHFTLIRDLLFRGTFGYTEWGHRDNTHMRWFTRSDIAGAIAEAGWHVARVGHSPLVRTARLDRLTRGRASQFIAYQSYVLATR